MLFLVKKATIPGLNLQGNTLAKISILANPDKNISHRFYFQTFKRKIPNLSFKPPRTDTCNRCDLLNAEIRSQQGD